MSSENYLQELEKIPKSKNKGNKIETHQNM